MILIRPRREIRRLKSALRESEQLLRLPDPKFFGVNESVSLWSPARQLHHIALVNEAAFRNIEKLFEAPPDSGKTLTVVGMAVMATGRIPRGRGRAPENVIPAEDIDRQLVTNALSDMEKELERLEDRVDELPRLRGRIRHFAFGQLTAVHWLRFAYIHAHHHLLIIRDILKGLQKSPGA